MAYLTINGINSCITWLNNTFPALVDVITLPEQSVESRTIRALRLRAGSGTGRRGVLFVGGVHARELMNSEVVLALAVKLCQAYTNNTGVTWGGRSFSRTQVRLVMQSLDIILIPCTNPDGRHHVQKPGGYPMWRKNRANYGTGHIGVDLNRNLDFLWNFTLGATSSDPSSEVYHGPSLFSEPETRNVRWVMNTYDDIRCFVDVHSYSQLILHPWGDDDTQTADPAQNFLNSTFDGMRGYSGGYAEYMTSRNKQRFEQTAVAISDAIQAVRGRTYTPQTGFDLYATTGTHSDYAFARHHTDGTVGKVYGFTYETGTEFQPAEAEKQEVIKEGCAGLMQMLIHCICAIETIGSELFTSSDMLAMRSFRDEEMMTSQLGRQLTELLELHSGEVSILVSERPKLREQASRVLSVALESLQTNTALPDSAVSDGLEILASLRRISGPELKTAIDEIEPLADQFRKRRLRTAVGVKRVTKGGAKKRN